MYKASAPGSLMLLGEYAVLYRQHAIVCAIDKRIYVTLTPRDDAKIILDSALGRYETTLNNLKSPVAPFQFILATLFSVRKYLRHGCHIKIESEFSETVGFASSAAVTVATLKVLTQWLDLVLTIEQFIKTARKIIRAVQGSGSGADVAGCVLGGIVFYRMQPFIAEKFPVVYPITVVYAGYKTPTPIAIKHVQMRFVEFPDIFLNIIKSINSCSLQGFAALKENDCLQLGNIMHIQQGFMDALGVNTFELATLTQILRQNPSLLGAKISGAGMGDCVIALGESVLDQLQLSQLGAQQIKVNMTCEGVRCEKS